jgi:hypothetical protein
MASGADFANRFSTLVIRFCVTMSRYYINKHQVPKRTRAFVRLVAICHLDHLPS